MLFRLVQFEAQNTGLAWLQAPGMEELEWGMCFLMSKIHTADMRELGYTFETPG
jgi:hypothetical protein